VAVLSAPTTAKPAGLPAFPPKERQDLAVHRKMDELTLFATMNRAALPNPSVKGTANGAPPGPGHRYAVHFLWPGPGVAPLAAPYLKR